MRCRAHHNKVTHHRIRTPCPPTSTPLLPTPFAPYTQPPYPICPVRGQMDDGSLDPLTLLKKLEAMDVRIVFMACQLRLQSKIYAASYKNKILYGSGYGWLSSWIHEDALRDATGNPDPDAVKGAQGVLGVREYVGTSTVNSVRAKFEQEWFRAASPAGCKTANAGYCDVDGKPGGAPAGNSPLSADSMMTFVHAMHSNDNYLDDSFRRSPSRICEHHRATEISSRDAPACQRLCHTTTAPAPVPDQSSAFTPSHACRCRRARGG
jgi:hypothetical protein